MIKRIPKLIMDKINQIDSFRQKQNIIHREVLDWFENQGVDIYNEGFSDVVDAKILYGEFREQDWIDYQNGQRK